MQSRCLTLESTYIPVATRRKALKRDNYRCIWCGEHEEHDVGLFIQKQAGGAICLENVITQDYQCKRKRHYDTPAEFIETLKLEQIDFPKEVKAMKVEVVWPSGKKVEGIVEELPPLGAKAFYLRCDGNGKRRQIYTEPGMQIIELGGEK